MPTVSASALAAGNASGANSHSVVFCLAAPGRRALLQVQAGVAGAVLLASVTAGEDALLPSVWACTLYVAVGLLQIVAALLVSKRYGRRPCFPA